MEDKVFVRTLMGLLCIVHTAGGTKVMWIMAH